MSSRSHGGPLPVILHVPHASTVVPEECLGDYLVDAARLRQHLAASTDHFTDELFAPDGLGPDVAVVRFPISRLAVDPERFEDDAHEVMAQHGLGVLYERGHDGTPLRGPLTPARRAWYLDRWYRPHHAALERAVDAALERAGCALIVDCHSFPAEPLALDLDRRTPRPDACLGTAGAHTPSWLVEAGCRWAATQGWSIDVDAPYAGSIVPSKRLGRDPRVFSVMVELNRARYMALDGTQARRTDGFAEARAFAAGMVRALRDAVGAEVARRVREDPGRAEGQAPTSRARFEFGSFVLPFMRNAGRERAEEWEVLHQRVPKEAGYLGSVQTEVSNWTSWRVDDHYYVLPLDEGPFRWALFRISWDDNYGHYGWSGDVRASGIANGRQAAGRMARALFRRWGIDLRTTENACYRDFLAAL